MSIYQQQSPRLVCSRIVSDAENQTLLQFSFFSTTLFLSQILSQLDCYQLKNT